MRASSALAFAAGETNPAMLSIRMIASIIATGTCRNRKTGRFPLDSWLLFSSLRNIHNRWCPSYRYILNERKYYYTPHSIITLPLTPHPSPAATPLAQAHWKL
jgi:hypothetical protein